MMGKIGIPASKFIKNYRMISISVNEDRHADASLTDGVVWSCVESIREQNQTVVRICEKSFEGFDVVCGRTLVL